MIPSKVVRYSRLIALLLLASLVTVGCVALPTDASWGSMSLSGTPAQIVFAFGARIVMVDPVDGSPSELRDIEGRIRLDEQGNPRVWRVQVEGGDIPANFYTLPLPIKDDTFLVASYEQNLYEIDTFTARVLNPSGFALPGNIVGSMILTEDVIYVPLSENGLTAIDRVDYLERWRFSVDRGVWAQPLLIDNLLIVPAMNHSLYAVDATTGDLRWQVDLGGALTDSPVFVDGSLYVSSLGSRVFRVSLEGEILASFETQDWVWGSPSVVDGVLYVGDRSGTLYALAIERDGFRQLWQRKVAERDIRMTPLVTADRVIVGARDRYVYWLNRSNGEEIFKREMRGEILADLLLLTPGEGIDITEPLIIVSTLAREEQLVGFTADTGERRWVYGS